MKVVIIIPAFNEARAIKGVVETLRKYHPNVLVIDDGSSDGTASIAGAAGATVYRHLINRGLGGALGTGMAAALMNGADIIVTFDADGQHEVADIERLILPIKEGRAEAVIGSRLLLQEHMPFRRRVYNRFANLITLFLFGIRTTDSQSGLRAFSREAAQKIRVRTNKMEVSSEFMKEIRLHRIRLEEVPIKPIYTSYSMSKGQNLFLGVKTLIRLIVLRLMK